jgi:diguanylate cyclase (GGDEF)-like protein
MVAEVCVAAILAMRSTPPSTPRDAGFLKRRQGHNQSASPAGSNATWVFNYLSMSTSYTGEHREKSRAYCLGGPAVGMELRLLKTEGLLIGPKLRNRLNSLGRLLQSGRAIVLLCTLLVAAIGATAGFTIWYTHQSTFEEHQRAMDSMGIVLAEQTSRYAQVIDLILQEVQSRIATLNVRTPADFSNQLSSQETHGDLAQRVKNVPQADAIAVIDADGLIVNWSRDWPVASTDTSDRDYFRYFREHDDPGVFVGSLSKGRASGKLSLFFARRVNSPEGKFLGLVLGIVDIRYLSEFYQAAGEHSKKAITLLRRDGTMLMRYPKPETAIGVKLPQGSPWYARVAEGGGSYVTPGALDGKPSLVSVHPLSDYPLVVDLLIEEANAFAQWRKQAVVIASSALAAALCFSGLFGMLARQFRRQANQNTRLDAVLSNITQGVCFFDSEKRLLLWNRRYVEIYNLPHELIRVGRSLEEIVAYRDVAGSGTDQSVSDYLGWHDRLAAANQPSNSVVALRNHRFVAICYQPMADGGWVATHEDVTERQRDEASLVFMARHDALTKLPNRILFRERIEQALDMAARGSQFAVFCLDLDKFKQVNDTMGHPAGDGLLVAVADRLQGCVREGDTVARLGGDEFAILQLAVRQPDDAEVLAARIISAFNQPFDLGTWQIVVGVSIGVTVVPGDSVSYETLMRDADIAMYLAKTEGGGIARFFEPAMDARIQMRRVLEQDIRGAILRNEFELYYQPQVDLIESKVVGFEALLRWHHPVRGSVSPQDFIPVAEETGMIVAIGEWVLRTACFEAENWPWDIAVAVNLSSVQFRKSGLVATVQAALAASGLRPDRLELEITESVLLRDTADTLAALHRLRAMGVSVALDDFGTGYSSLSYLRCFPFSKIKIDQSFVHDLMTNRESMSIIRAVIGLGESLGIKTTAEGVETLEQLNMLRKERCTEVQGYFFSRPRPAGEVPLLIEKLQRIGTRVFSYEAD